jgi:hypothetical protein
MCKICKPILGNESICTSEKDCPLRQAAYCAQCASTGHFQKDCKYQANTNINEIPCLSPEPHLPKLYLRDDPKSVSAFLTKHKLQIMRMKEGLTKEERRKIEEKQKKVLIKYLDTKSVSYEFISTAWTIDTKKKYIVK